MNGGHPCLAGYRQGSRTKGGWLGCTVVHALGTGVIERGWRPAIYPREIHCGGLNEHGCTCSITGVAFASQELIATRGRWGMYNSL